MNGPRFAKSYEIKRLLNLEVTLVTVGLGLKGRLAVFVQHHLQDRCELTVHFTGLVDTHLLEWLSTGGNTQVTVVVQASHRLSGSQRDTSTSHVEEATLLFSGIEHLVTQLLSDDGHNTRLIDGQDISIQRGATFQHVVGDRQSRGG